MKGTLCGRSYEIQYMFLENRQTFRISLLESKLFHSIKVEGKKEFLKQSRLTLKRGILFLCLVIDASLAFGTDSKGYLVVSYYFEEETKFSVPLPLLKGSKAWFLVKFFSGTTSYNTCYCKCCIILNRFELFMKRIIKIWSYKMSP